MSSHLVFNGCDDAVKARLESYWAKKLPRLEKLLATQGTDFHEVGLTVAVSCQRQGPERAWYEARAAIDLPSGKLTGAANDNDPQAALDRVADTLATEVKRHRRHVRRQRRARARTELRAAEPLLQEHAESGRREDFFRLLRPHLRFLRDHARRDLTILELEGPLHRREMTAADLVDEVLSRAWQRFAQRPRHLPLDLWLTRLLHETLEDWVKQEPRPHVSLEDSAAEAAPDEVLAPEDKKWEDELEQEWWDELPLFEETPAVEDLIPSSAGPDDSDDLETDERRDRLLSLLGELPALQRRTFLLYALDDYSPAEIARLQDRPESDLRADIEAARRTLRERLLAAAPGGGNETAED